MILFPSDVNWVDLRLIYPSVRGVEFSTQQSRSKKISGYLQESRALFPRFGIYGNRGYLLVKSSLYVAVPNSRSSDVLGPVLVGNGFYGPGLLEQATEQRASAP